MDFEVTKLTYLGGVALIIALVQICKMWIQDGRFYPILALLFGVTINVILSMKLGLDVFDAVFAGLLAGLTACGIYSADASITKPPE